MQTRDAFLEAVRRHDRRVAERGLVIWAGGEPTFTQRYSAEPEWLGKALGGDKEARAGALLALLARDFPGACVLRSVGRQYPEEERPRFSLGLYARRDGRPLWSGPRDPLLLAPDAVAHPVAPGRLRDALARRLAADGLACACFAVAAEPAQRLAFRLDGLALDAELARDGRAARPAADAEATPEEGLADELAAEGVYLIGIGPRPSGGPLWVELPSLPDRTAFERVLAALAEAAREVELGALVLGGFPPPIDAEVAWLTVTPDPGVVEVNMAPALDVASFLAESRRIHAAAAGAELAPYRLNYTGRVADSGGGGQLTFGGPTPEESPFFVHPQLLPRLVVYLNHHPSLSYSFAFDSIGSSSQSPRPDEGVRESFDELALALALLEREGAPSPETIWASLAPFLTDRFGNTHRSEANIEKLWNPYLPWRGCLGLVELRALRMSPTPEHAAAIAALFRSIVARLALGSAATELVDWGAELHDRFALPFYLERDLAAVFADLERSGFGLDAPITAELTSDHRDIGVVALGEFEVRLRRAIEFWPLVGDQSSVRGTSRLVDPGTSRHEVTIRARDGRAESLAGLRLACDGYVAEPRLEQDLAGRAVGVLGLRYRSFVPRPGLHPTLAPHGPLGFDVLPVRGPAARFTLHPWIPGGGAYDDLPRDLAEAARRRRERLVVEPLARPDALELASPPSAARTPYSLDLRWLPRAPSAERERGARSAGSLAAGRLGGQEPHG